MSTPTLSGLTLDPAVLVLEDGSRHRGRAYGARGTTLGEVVFATGMTGYQETLTDPSYAGQIVLQTAPHIGNTGMNAEDPESRRIWVAGYIVRDPSRVVSNWRADESLDDALVRDGIVGISGIDTRAITRVLRSAGSMRGGVFSGEAATWDADEQLRLVREAPAMAGQNLSAAVSVSAAEVTPAVGERLGNLAVLDKQTGRVEITAHNLGFAVDAPLEGAVESPAGYGRVEVSHIGLNDNVVEGLRALDIPAFSVQYHPEAAAGPHDANYLFDRFADLVRADLDTRASRALDHRKGDH